MTYYNPKAVKRRFTALQKKGLTYRKLAALMDVTERTSYTLINGQTTPGADVLARLADALEVPVGDLFNKGKKGATK